MIEERTRRVFSAVFEAGKFDFTGDDFARCLDITKAVMLVLRDPTRAHGPGAVIDEGPSTGKENPHMTTTVKVHVGGQYRATVTYPGGMIAVGPDEEKSFHLPHPGGVIEITEDYIGNLDPAPTPGPQTGGDNPDPDPMEGQPANEEDPADDADPNKPASGSEPA